MSSTIDERFERRLARFAERDILGLSTRQIYPPRGALTTAQVLPERVPLLDKSTPVASMGSCFAREIKDHLEGNGFDYIKYGEGPALRHGSAPWERVYNTRCILQEVERAFGHFHPDLLVRANGKVIDPHRKKAVFGSLDEADVTCKNDAAAANKALTDARIFVLTLGLSEVWLDLMTNKAFAEPLPNDLFDGSRHGFKLLSPEENVINLKAAMDLLRANNPGIEVILTVSPIPLRATFLNRGVVVSNVVSKASLIWAAHEITSTYEWVHYFPSYEIVTTLLIEPFGWDLRHITREAAAEVMTLFDETYAR